MIVAGLAAYFLLGRAPSPGASPERARPAATATTTSTETAAAAQGTPATGNDGHNRSFISELFGAGSPEGAAREWYAVTVLLRFALASLLASLLAFRPRRRQSIVQRNPFVAQTQILLALVSAAMMMIVGDSAARAFGIFAAASLVRFRTNIRDPKEITVLLICLGVGLAAGVGRWEMAIILTLFVLATLWILEYFESAQVFRAMELGVATRNVDQTQEVLKQLFARHKFSSELRGLDREDAEEPLGKIVYQVNLSNVSNTDRLSEEIFSADPQNIDSVEWAQKKNTTYIYG
jgi:hypothetical protein